MITEQAQSAISARRCRPGEEAEWLRLRSVLWPDAGCAPELAAEGLAPQKLPAW